MPPGAVQRGAPYFVLTSVSEASLASLGTASLLASLGTVSPGRRPLG